MIIELGPTASINLTTPPYDTEGLTCVILGNKGSGKSNIMAVMAEESHRNGIPFIYYDPNGDAVALRELGDDVLIIGDPGDPEAIRRAHYPLAVAMREPNDFIRMVLQDGYSLVLDMREQDGVHPLQVFSALVEEHFRQAVRLREPAFMFVDEAQAVAPQTGLSDVEKVSRRALGKVISDGRKRGIILAAASQHAAYLDKRVIRGANLRIFGKCTYLPDYKVIKEYTPATFHQMLKLRSGQVYIVSEKAHGLTEIKKRNTSDLGQTPAFRPRAPRERPSLGQLQLPMSVDISGESE